MIKLKSPGMRTIKTALVVALCLILSKALDLKYPYYAAVASIICTQNTVHGSFNIAKNRAIGTIIGSLLGILFVYVFSYNPWSSGIGVLILLYFLKITRLEDSYRVACIVYLATFIPGHGHAIAYGFHRTIATIIGIAIALFVNLLLSPPEYSDDIKTLSYNLINDLTKYCGNLFIYGKEMELSRIGFKIIKIEALVENYKQDITKSNIKSIDIDNLDSLIVNSKKIYNHLGIINELYKLNYSFTLNEENAGYINYIYNYNISIEKYEKNYSNEVFNYHIKEIIKYLDSSKDLRIRI